MKLFEHPDFEQAIIRAAEHFRPRGLRESIIEKVSVRRVHPGPRPPKPTAREGDDTETGGRWGRGWCPVDRQPHNGQGRAQGCDLLVAIVIGM